MTEAKIFNYFAKEWIKMSRILYQQLKDLILKYRPTIILQKKKWINNSKISTIKRFEAKIFNKFC
jgi:hypothetical protein